MRTASKRCVLVASVTFCALSLAVQTPEAVAGDSYLLVKAGAYDPQGDQEVKDLGSGFNGEIVAGHYFLPFLGAEIGAGYIEVSKDSNKLTVYPVTLAARLRLPIPIVKPYAIAGGGAYFSKAETAALGSQDDTTVGYFAGAGVDFKVLFLLVNIEAKYLWANPTFAGVDTKIDGVVGTVGVGLEF